MFVSIPPLRISEKPGEWILTEPLIYQSQLFDLTIQVPSGFPTNLASIPRPFRNLISINGKHRAPSMLHDYLYSIQGEYKSDRLSRSDCDAMFKEAMGVAKVNWFQRQAMHAAVRIGGWLHW